MCPTSDCHGPKNVEDYFIGNRNVFADIQLLREVNSH